MARWRRVQQGVREWKKVEKKRRISGVKEGWQNEGGKKYGKKVRDGRKTGDGISKKSEIKIVSTDCHERFDKIIIGKDNESVLRLKRGNLHET